MARKRASLGRTESTLRIAAEAALEHAPPSAPAPMAFEQLLHELRVREIELEMQNEELRRSHLALEESRDRYLDLYEFAPVGYLTLRADGLITEMNLTCAALLGQERSKLLLRPLSRFIDPEDGDLYYRHLARVLKHGEGRSISIRLKRSDQSNFHVQLDCIRFVREGASPLLRVTLVDINATKHSEAQIQKLAFYDALTQLPNRRLLMDRLRQALASSSRTRRHGAILFLDLDDFKTLNDTQGHDVGDLLLKSVASRLLANVREGDTVARLGGDEFVVMLQGLSEIRLEAVAQAKAIGEKVLASIKAPHGLVGQDYRSSASMGVSFYDGSQASCEELLKQADLALYRAKAATRGALKFYDPEMQATVTARAVLESDLRRGLDGRQFVLHYQKQVDERGQLVGAEALIRWQHPTCGLLMPYDFIPFSEEKGLIGMLGLWVLETACSQLATWSRDPKTAHLTVSINVSALEFNHPDFVNRTRRIISLTGADPQKLVLEITESVMLAHMDQALEKIRALKESGVRFALDDFGVGYSSINYLKHLSLDHLKIDQSFVRDVLNSPVDQAIARIIVVLGQSLGLKITVEGIETSEQRDFFASLGCRCFQGYFFGRPSPVEDLLTPSVDLASATR